MFHLIFLYVDMKPVFPVGIFEIMIIKNYDRKKNISAVNTIKFKEPI